MSYIHDDVQMIKSCIKFIDEDKIVDFLNSIQFKSDEDYEVDKCIFQTSNSKLIESYINNYYVGDYNYEDIEAILNEDNNISDIAFTIIKNKLVKEKHPDVIYKILNSSLVTWNRSGNPFETGYYDGGNGNVSNDSILNQEEVNTLFSIYASHEGWYTNKRVEDYVKDKESLTEKIKKDGGAPSIDEVIDFLGEDFVKDYFDGNIPDSINSATYADMLIEGDIY